VSRHRSPGGRAHPDPLRGAATTRARTTAPATRVRRGDPAAVRNGLAAAAAIGGTLAVAVPIAATDGGAGTASTAQQVLLRTSEATGPAATAPDPARLAAVLPVVTREDPLPPQAQADDLVKAADLAERARRAAEEEAARAAAATCDADVTGIGPVQPWVRDAARFLSCLYDHPDLIGVAGRGRVSDHPGGLALDLMVRGERGDRLAACALANREALGISYVIWEQRIHHGDGWEPMADRGGDTENHVDHVHVSFERRAPGGAPLAQLCE
jgi:hypothetical protein